MIDHAAHHFTWSQHLIWWLCNQFGSLTILGMIGTGAMVWIIIIFKNWIRDRFGDFIEWADVKINGKK